MGTRIDVGVRCSIFFPEVAEMTFLISNTTGIDIFYTKFTYDLFFSFFFLTYYTYIFLDFLYIFFQTSASAFFLFAILRMRMSIFMQMFDTSLLIISYSGSCQ